MHYYLHEYLLTCVTWYGAPTHSQLAVQLKVTAAVDLCQQASMHSLKKQFLSPGSVTTIHILLPHVQTWMALNSLRDQNSLPLNLSRRL